MAPDGAPTLADQVSKLYDLIAGFHATHLLEIARQLGVWEALTERPGTTSADLAGRLGTDAFYTDVLCRTAFSFGLLARDGEGWRMAPHFDQILGDPDSSFYLALAPKVHMVLGEDYPGYIGHFRAGTTRSYQEHGEVFMREVAAALRTLPRIFLDLILPRLPGLQERLGGGARLLDVGCGAGWAVVQLAELDPSAPAAVAGYSQGGGAAGWAAQLQPVYAPSLPLVGVAAGGTPADLRAVATQINGSFWFAFLAGTAIGFDAAYPFLDLDRYLTAEGEAAARELSGLCVADGLLRFAGRRIEDYTVGGTNPIDRPAWRLVLRLNDLGAVPPAVPLLQFHGRADQIIPWEVEAALHRRWCALGVTTQLNGYDGDHVQAAFLAQADVVRWLEDRFAGRPAAANC